MEFELVALLSTAFFTSAAFYVSFVEHPARLASGTVAALNQWRPSYKRAAAMQIILSLIALLSSILAFVMTQELIVLIAGLLLATVAPWTLIVIMPINRQLLDPSCSPDSPETQKLLLRWGQLHAVRTGISFLALSLFIGHLTHWM